MPTSFDVFICHSELDKAMVLPLAERLKQANLRVWYDKWEILVGDSIPHKTEQGLVNSSYFIVCISANLFDLDGTIAQIQTVRYKDPLNLQRQMIPLRLDDNPPPPSLAQFKHIDWRKPSEESWQQLLQACGHASSSSAPPSNAHPEPPPDHAAERIQQTRDGLLRLLNKKCFPDLPDLAFAADGMPQTLSQIFKAVTPHTTRAHVSEKCTHAIWKLAQALMAAIGKLPSPSKKNPSPLSSEKKTELRKNFILAMQQAILLSVREDKLLAAQVDAAYHHPANPLDLEYALSASLLTRANNFPEMAHASIAPGSLPVFDDKHFANAFGEVERGTNTPNLGKQRVAQAKTDRQGAETEILRVLWSTALPAEIGGYTPDAFGQLQAQMKFLKDEEQAILAILNAQDGPLSAEFIQWLHQLHLGLLVISKQKGIFEYSEHEWRIYLAKLYETLRPFAPQN